MFGINKNSLFNNSPLPAPTQSISPFGVDKSPLPVPTQSISPFGVDKSPLPAPIQSTYPVSNDIVHIGQLLNKVAADLTAVHQKVEETSIILNNKIDKVLASFKTQIYVACPLHNHVLLETSSVVIGDTYQKGFMCDICKKTCNNPMEKFYQCSQCPSSVGIIGGKFDVCAECIRKQLAT